MRIVVSRITEYKIEDLESATIECVNGQNHWTKHYRVRLTFKGTMEPLVLDKHNYVDSAWNEVRLILTQMREAAAEGKCFNLTQKVGESGEKR